MNICEQCQCETKEEEKRKKISLVLFSFGEDEGRNKMTKLNFKSQDLFEKIKRKSIQILILTRSLPATHICVVYLL